MIKARIEQSVNNGDTHFIHTISSTEFLNSRNTLLGLVDRIYNYITRKISEKFLREHSAEILARIDVQELANLVKNRIALDIQNRYCGKCHKFY